MEASLTVHMLQLCLWSKCRKKVTPMNEYPCQANCCINSSRINEEINSIKSSVVHCRGDAYRWLCARCQKPRENPPKRTWRYPGSRPRPDGEAAQHLFMIVYRRRENPGRVEFVHFFWAVGRNRAKKVSGMWV